MDDESPTSKGSDWKLVAAVFFTQMMSLSQSTSKILPVAPDTDPSTVVPLVYALNVALRVNLTMSAVCGDPANILAPSDTIAML